MAQQKFTELNLFKYLVAEPELQNQIIAILSAANSANANEVINSMVTVGQAELDRLLQALEARIQRNNKIKFYDDAQKKAKDDEIQKLKLANQLLKTQIQQQSSILQNMESKPVPYKWCDCGKLIKELEDLKAQIQLKKETIAAQMYASERMSNEVDEIESKHAAEKKRNDEEINELILSKLQAHKERKKERRNSAVKASQLKELQEREPEMRKGAIDATFNI